MKEEDLSLDSLKYNDPVLRKVVDAFRSIYNDVDWMFSDDEREALFFEKPVRFYVDAELDGKDVRLVQNAVFIIRIAGEMFVRLEDYHPKNTDVRGTYFRPFRYFGISQMFKMRLALKESRNRVLVDKKWFDDIRYSVFGYSKKSPFRPYIDAFYHVTDERRRQVDRDGLTLKAAAAADEDYDLAKAAFCLTFNDITKYSDGVPCMWPYTEERWKELTEGRSREERLASAAAMLVAEMEKDAGEHECIRRVIEHLDDIEDEKHNNGDILSRVRGRLSRYIDLGDDDDNDLAGNIYALPDVVVDMIHVLGNIRQETAHQKKK